MTFFVTRLRIRRLALCRIRLAAEGEFGMAPWSSAIRVKMQAVRVERSAR